ncbi:MAG: secretion protein HlyD family protein [Hyphomicrobiales bacterium]|nr:secretion protein HlyD family protein [Hyphomicrobiales bacterium]
MSSFDRPTAVPQATFEQADSGRGFDIKAAPVREPAVPLTTRRSPRRFILPLLIVAALGGAGWFGWGWWTQGRFIVSTDDAYVRADMATIATKISGYVATVSVSNNSPVRAGDLLVTVDDGDYRLAVEAARRKVETQGATITRLVQQAGAQEAAVAQGQAGLEAAQADSVRAANEFERSTNLNRTGFGTQQKSEQALADRDRTRAAVRNAQAALEGARANLAVVQAQKVEAEHLQAELATAQSRAQRDLDATRIRAPFDGVVGNKAAQPGQFVQPGTRLLALVPLASVYVEANFKETQLTRLKTGQAVTFSVDSAGPRTFTGTLESFAPASGSEFSLLPPENATGNFTKIVQRVPVRVKIPADVAAQGLLRPGLSAVVNIDTRDVISSAAN